MFTNAIVRKPCKNMINGLTSSDFGIPDFDRAVEQHQQYILALKNCGLEVFILEGDEKFPDSVFVEDVALLTPDVAIVTNPGADSRRDEVIEMKSILFHYYKYIRTITPPGTIEAGDIMMVGTHFYIGLSERTNEEGAKQMIHILNQFGKTGSTVPLNKMLHLKTGLSFLEGNNMLVAGEFIHHPEFRKFNVIRIPDHEAYAANSVWINGKVLVPSGNPETEKNIAELGYQTISLDVSEFRKLDGGLSCLSLRF